MEAQGQRKETVFCDKCYTVVPKGSEFCPNCGASLSDAPGAEGSDSEVYPELARANLFRMRKSFKEAEDICLAILRRYPHNLSANALLGDISVEENNLSQASEWYELALDIEPDSTTLQDKLHAVREQMENETAATTAEQLGLPTQKPKTWLIAVLVVGILGVIALGAYFASRGSSNPHRLSQNEIDKPVVGGDSNNNLIQPATTGTDGGKTTATTTGGSQDDQDLTNLLSSKPPDGAYVDRAQFDPPVEGISITYIVPSEQNERKIGASLAAESFDLVKENFGQDINQVELRALRNKQLFYSAIVRREDYEATQDPAWQSSHQSDPDALMKAILSNEQYSNNDGSTDTGTSGDGATAGGDSSGGSTGASGATGSSTTGSSGGGQTAGSTSGNGGGSATGGPEGSSSGSQNSSGSTDAQTGKDSGSASPSATSGKPPTGG